ncbi:MAG TPA: oligosaccharide flippase family protein [Gaiellaceae bacterium]
MIRKQIGRLAKQSLVYGTGGIVSRVVAIFLLPVYTSFLPPKGYGAVALILATEAVLVILLRAGIQNAFFRFYYLTSDPIRRRTVVRTSFWYTMTAATAGLVLGLIFAPQIASFLGLRAGQTNFVRAGSVFLWGDMNYQQQTAIFRAEQRSISYAIASVSNVIITICSTLLLVVGLHKGAIGLIVGNFTGTLCVYTVLLAYRIRLLGFEFDRRLYRAMEHFGLPLLPSALALWATKFSDRFFVNHYLHQHTVGVYSFGVQIASALVLIITAFQLAWPAFAYSIEDDEEARHTYAYVLTYFLYFMTWVAVALSLLAPFLAHFLAGRRSYWPGADVVPVLAFGSVIFAGYSVVVISIGRVRKTGANWIITGLGALANVIMNIILIPRVGMIGAAWSLLGAYGAMFIAMSWHAQRLFYVPYQWRRIVTVLGVGAGLVLVGKYLSISTPLAVAFAAAYPVLLFVFFFYQASERKQIARLARRVLHMQPA